MPSVFLSYFRSDLPLIEQLEAQLTAHPDISVWRDQENIYGGELWPKRLGEEIANKDVFLLAWSKHSAASHFVEFEWCTAIALKKTIVPCLLDETPLAPSLSTFHGYRLEDVTGLITSLRGTPLADGQRREPVIRKLSDITATEETAVLAQAKAVFAQQQSIVQGNVYQAGGDIHTHNEPTAPTGTEKAKPLVEKWQAWVGLIVAILTAILALLQIQDKILPLPRFTFPGISTGRTAIDAGSTNNPHAAHSAVRLQDDRALIIGGNLNGQRVTFTEWFDPSISKFIPGPLLSIGRGRNQTVLLADWRVLVLGDNGRPEKGELYDPQANAFTLTQSPTVSQRNSFFTATLLKDGRVFLAGSGQSGLSKKVELYDPTHDTFISSSDLLYERMGHTATLLEDETVLIAGNKKPSEIYNMTKGPVQTGDLSIARRFHTATRLPNGDVLIVGGRAVSGASVLDSAEVFHLREGEFEITGRMALGRIGHTSTLTPDGSVIVIGGITQPEGQGEQPTDLIEQYDYNNKKFTEIGRLRTARAYHTTTLLKDGRLLVVGGVKKADGAGRENIFATENVLRNAEIVSLYPQ
jgi:hypothetical protein